MQVHEAVFYVCGLATLVGFCRIRMERHAYANAHTQVWREHRWRENVPVARAAMLGGGIFASIAGLATLSNKFPPPMIYAQLLSLVS